jgi:hypothetical protein
VTDVVCGKRVVGARDRRLEGGGRVAAFSGPRGVAYSAWRAGARHRYIERERFMRQFMVGLFITLAFGVIVLGALFGIFTLVSYLAGPVGG